MRLYIIGPVSGFPDGNKEQFNYAKDTLWHCGYTCVIPHDFIPSDAPWSAAMKMSIRTMLGTFDGVAHLDKPMSRGSRIETMVAKICGLPVKYVHEWELEACKSA